VALFLFMHSGAGALVVFWCVRLVCARLKFEVWVDYVLCLIYIDLFFNLLAGSLLMGRSRYGGCVFLLY